VVCIGSFTAYCFTHFADDTNTRLLALWEAAI
jgi:hypothetical protein